MSTQKKPSFVENIKTFLRNTKRAFQYSWESSPGTTVGVFLFSIIIAIIPFAQAKVLGSVVNVFVETLGTGIVSAALWGVVALYIAVSTIPDLLYAIKGYLDRRWRLQVQKHLDILLAEKRGALDLAYHDSPDYQNLLQRVWWRGIWPLFELAESQFTNLQNVVQVILASVIVLGLNVKIFAIILVASIPKLIVEMKYGKEVYGIWAEDSEVRRRYYNTVENFTDRHRVIQTKLLQSNSYLLSILREMMNIFLNKEERLDRKKLGLQILSVLCAAVGYGFGIVILIQDVIAGAIAIGTLIFVLASLDRLSAAISGFFLSVANQYGRNFQASDILKIIDTEPFLPRPANPKPLNLSTAPEITFENVSFHYAGQTKLILQDVSFTIPPGEKVALVGNNGAGKTTLIKLLCRVYDPVNGRILINGIDLREIDIDEWWGSLGVLFQDFSSYDMRVKESIAMGRADKPLAMHTVVSSAELSGADEFIKEWPTQYEQMIGVDFKGVEPSKGQNQKLALARVAYRQAHLLILDEPTASVDAESEEKIFEKLENLPDTISAILISHRFSTVRKADKILVLEDGRISESGNHDSLLKADGTYAKLFRLQAKGYDK